MGWRETEIDSASIAPFPSWPDGLKRKKRHENANRYAFTIRYYAMSFRVARIDMMIHSVFRSARPLLSMIKIISPAPRRDLRRTLVVVSWVRMWMLQHYHSSSPQQSLPFHC